MINVGFITEPTGAHIEAYLDSMAKCRNIAQVAVADESGQAFDKARSSLAARYPNLRTFRDPAEMLRTVRPQLAVVTLEPHRSPPAIAAALQADCHVLSEKPACVRAEDFEPLVRIADSRKRHLMLALANRSIPQVRKAREVVQAGDLGTLYAAEFYTIADQSRLKRPEYQRSWRAVKAKAGGGYLIWLGIHWIDLVEYISGDRIREVCGFARNVGGQPIEVEDAAVLAVMFEKGMVGTHHSGYYLDRGYQSLIAIWGSQGWLRGPFDVTQNVPLEWYSTRPGSPRGSRPFRRRSRPRMGTCRSSRLPSTPPAALPRRLSPRRKVSTFSGSYSACIERPRREVSRRFCKEGL